ncbi:hypothetical protein BVRB_041050, partial [Beta vulgaris subsp. vulgaris]
MGRLLGQAWNATSRDERIPFQLLREQLPADIEAIPEQQPETVEQLDSELTAAAIINESAGGHAVPEIFPGSEDIFVVPDENTMFSLSSVDFENDFKKPIRTLSFIDELEDQKA